MMFKRAAAALLAAFVGFTLTAHAVENTWDYSVRVSVTVQNTPAAITLAWPQDTNGTPSSYAISRKAPGAGSWNSLATLPGSATSYTDSSVSAGSAYEYRIVKVAGGYTGYGYVQAGVDAALVDRRGTVVLVVDNTFTSSLATELARLERDLAGDGWTVVRRDVSRGDSPASVKNVIRTVYQADPANVKSVFLFGHVPVPYSGDLYPDGHSDHRGAWPADAYYGDMDGNWTDGSVSVAQTLNTDPADAARLTNLPGDGKFDQTQLPSAVELAVGRVDLSNMPGRVTWGGPATFKSEAELLRQYLQKDHNFRHRVTNPARRALLGDYFGARGGEAFAASGFRSFAPLVGASNIRNLNTEYNDQRGIWISQAAASDYLLAYGCGAGSYSSISGLGNDGAYNAGTTTEMVSNNVRGVFNLLFGSWLGDWDHEDSILRAPLATEHGLASAWSGRPHWFIHPMGLGDTIGDVTRLTQNNSGLYETQINSSANRIHIALMGDPTLRLHPVVPAANLAAAASGGAVTLTWSASSDASISGYHVYRASSASGPFTRLTSSPVTSLSYSDPSATAGATYMVRAIKLETTPSGSYFNASQGIFAAVGETGTSTPPPPAADTTAPSVAFSGPAAGATVTGNAVTVAVSATDNVGVAGVQFKLDGANLGGEDTSAPFSATFDSTLLANGTHTLGAVARDAAGNMASATQLTVNVSNTTSGTGTTTTPPPSPSTGGTSTPTTTGLTLWFDDALPGGSGGGAGGDGWNWVTSGPAPYSGTKAHQSNLAAGLHEHFFNWAAPMSVATGDVLVTYVYLDPANVPTTLMLSWNNGNWEHRAYWGANEINYGANNTPGRVNMGAIPAAGQWVRLEVPAAAVGLEGSSVAGMCFSLFNGRATWDATGKASASAPPPPTSSTPPTTTEPSPTTSGTTKSDTVWFDDALPAGAGGGGTNGGGWYWVASSPAPFAGTQAHQTNLAAGVHEHFFNWAAPLKVATGDSLYTYVYLDPANMPSEIMLSWNDGSWEHRAYWGGDRINYGTRGTAGRYYAGALPAPGQWVRLEVPASAVALEGSSIQGMAFSLYDGRATFDQTGKSTPTATTSPGSGGTAPASQGTEYAWFDDALPVGAFGSGWTWTATNPAPFSGSLAVQSSGPGLHERVFNWAGATMNVAAGDTLYAYVYLDPNSPPTELMLSWGDGNWEHRAYWGADQINYGTRGTPGRYYAGALPAAGQWVRLEVPASAVGLEGSTVQGMCFSAFDGRVTYDKAGRISR